MSLLISSQALLARRQAIAGPLAPLASSLASDLDRAIASRPSLPREKARLSRHGGRCSADGSMLDFDPYAPGVHRCPRCGATYTGTDHDRWWIVWYQLWIAERAVHGALLELLTGERRFAELADDILTQAADRYLDYPNVDNVLGPSRPFFSTYLESIWLLQLCVALDLREESGHFDDRLGARVRDRVIEPSSALIDSYDEGGSNRQVWNSAALLAAAGVLSRDDLAVHAIDAPSGLLSQLVTGLLGDGTWYEGENYHLFAVRGLWYGVTMAERRGLVLDAERTRRFRESFATPFLTALPDFTFPSRRDSQYAVSLRQWRIAELAELGLARSDDERLSGALTELYRGDLPEGDSGRWRSTADAERNEVPVRLDRSALGWRSLLHARARLPESDVVAPGSVLLPGQGLAILRRDRGTLYAALDYGHHGGGHGHPDRLNLILSHGSQRWLDDPGTGSYVDSSLAWYRSSLAHNAPMIGGRTQPRTAGRLLAWEDRGGAGWIDAEAALDGAVVRRAVVAMPDYVLDIVEWENAGDGILLPLHVKGGVEGVVFSPTEWPTGFTARDAGFAFTSNVEAATPFDEARVIELGATHEATGADVFLALPAGARFWRFMAPGPPGRPQSRSHAVTVPADKGTVAIVWSTMNAVASVAATKGELHVHLHDGTQHEHARRGAEWHVEFRAGRARSSVDLTNTAADFPSGGDDSVHGDTRAEEWSGVPHAPVTIPRHHHSPSPTNLAASITRIRLGEPHYRRSELSWEDAGRPTAELRIAMIRERVHLELDVHKALDARPALSENPLDNERSDTNSDGVQLHLGPRGEYAWLLVPESDGNVRVTPGHSASNLERVPIDATWEPFESGWRMIIVVAIPDGVIERDRGALDVVINEIVPGRERRRGQLALSGGGDYVYLQGDRAPSRGPVPFVIVDV